MADEENCFSTSYRLEMELRDAYTKRLPYYTKHNHHLDPPAVVNFDLRMYPKTYFTPLHLFDDEEDQRDAIRKCPQTHFQCPGDGYCLPVFVLCNGMYDCPGHEDEAHCEKFACPGFYRCRVSRVCLHPDHVCDGFPHCKQQDDERFCGHVCPSTSCTCQGLSFHCRTEFRVERFPDVRYLDASDSGLRPARLWNNTMLVFLALQRCGLTTLSLPPLPNLVILDVSYNDISTLNADLFQHVCNLKELQLTSNPLIDLFEGNISSESPTLHSLPVLHVLSLLTLFNVSQSGLQRVTGNLPTPQLQTLDVTGCDLQHLPRHWLTPLSLLRSVHTDDPMLCCAENLPAGFKPEHCQSPPSLLSSCHRLLGSAALRAVTVLLAAVALLGNGVHLFFLLRGDQQRRSGAGVFVCQLSVSSLVMGVYLLAVCVADQVYQGQYLWEDRGWRYSAWCSLCSFLYLFSVQVSALILLCLTVSHCVHLARPHILQVWATRQVLASSLLCWGTGFLLSTILHVFPWTLHHQTALCVSLPLTSPLGEDDHALHAVITVDTLLMVLVTAGQLYISTLVHLNPIVFLVDSTKSHQLDSARCTLHISVTEACGWFLVDVLVLLMPDINVMTEETRSAVTAFVLPSTVAVHPVLHVLNVALERRRHTKTQRVLQRVRNTVAEK